MANGIEISNGTIRTLSLDGVAVAEGGNLNRAGLYVIGNKLYLDGAVIAESNNALGLIRKADGLYYGDVQVGTDIPEPPTPPSAGLWLPPTQEASTYNKYNYETLIDAYDDLKDNSSYTGTITKTRYSEDGYGDYPLWHYEFTPANYTKTFYVQACIHGNEKDAPQTILRIFNIICNHCNESAYSRLRPLRDNVRFIVVPCVNPWGFDNAKMNVPWTDWNGVFHDIDKAGGYGMNMNRNFDFIHKYGIDGTGCAGNYPFQRSEVRHVKSIIEGIGVQNIDYLFDNHDGGDVKKHFWFNYNMDGPNAEMARKLLADLIEYEDTLIANGGTDYRRPMSYVIKAGDTALDYTNPSFDHHVKKLLQVAVSTQEIADLINANGITFTGSTYLLHNVVKSSNGTDTEIRSDRSTYILAEDTPSVTITSYKVNDVDTPLVVAVGDTIKAIVTPQADSEGWVHPNVADSSGYSTGTTSAWANSTLGIPASGPEYIGGYFGYSFNSEQMTRSLRIRANLLIYAYELLDTKGWLVNEDGDYFHFDYPIAMTRQGLRKDGVTSANDNQIVSINDVYDRWDALVENYPTYVSKSAKLGENSSGDSIYSYTLGNGNKKVLLLGGSMRYAVDNKITEFGMYVLAEYLCNNYVVAQSSFLQTLKQDYTIVVLPCIDFIPGHHTTGNYERSLNNSYSSYAKWQISNDKCVPTTYGNGAADVGIFMDWLEANDDAVALISGGELKTTASAVGKPDYSTEYMTQVIIPKNLIEPDWLTDYCNHIEDDRGEDKPDVENTAGATCGDYAFDNYDIPTFFINLNVSQMWDERKQYAQPQDSADRYMYRNYETGRRIANIVNFILMAGGDISNNNND